MGRCWSGRLSAFSVQEIGAFLAFALSSKRKFVILPGSLMAAARSPLSDFYIKTRYDYDR
jgi:hypothetical protein